MYVSWWEIKKYNNKFGKEHWCFLELAPQFGVMHRDQMFTQILSQEVKRNKLDVCAQFNYALLLYSTEKV
jgi:hypothetical protein